ncbi:MAG: hypothetical protein IJX28_06975 [Clostridia bacterium]|nr:hypothetical protein [Clostridia bacterium]
MKRFLLLLLGVIMLMTTACQSTPAGPVNPSGQSGAATQAPTAEPLPLEEQTLNVAEHLDDVFRTLGRTYVKDGWLQMDFACSGIHFVAECEGSVKIRIRTERKVRFTVYVDGVRVLIEPIITDGDGSYITVAHRLERGVHEFRIVDATQFIWGNAAFESVQITGNFLEKPKDRDLFLEFYGDSILNGSNVRMGGSSVENSDSTQAFGWVTAELMNADMSLIGCGGIGLTKNKRSFWMKDVMEYCGAQYSLPTNDPSGYLLPGIPKYDFARIPDAVIIEQGVNDGSNATTPLFKTELTNMIHLLREKYGKEVPIVLLVGYTSGGKYNTAIPTIIQELGGESANLYVCKLSNAAASKDIGGDGTHPNVETSAKMARELSEYLKTLLNK